MLAITLRVLGLFFVFDLATAAPSLNREIILAPHSGDAPEDIEIVRWQSRAAEKDVRAEVFERLAWAYVAKARRTLDSGFYKLAEKTADVIDAEFGVNAESRLLRGHVLHNLHRFREAELVARELTAERGLPADFALLSDALIEQGKLTEGVAALQRLVELKPGVEAWSRIAYLRWLKGDLAGALAAMDSAVQVSNVRDAETCGWLLSRLSGLHLQRGDAAFALELAEGAAERVSEYPPALLAQGRALLALGRVVEAIEPLRRAEQLQPLPEYQWWLADALVAAGRSSDASAVEQRLKTRGAETDPRTLALFLATRGEEPARALRLARAELAGRADVFSHDALAWALAATGDREAATAEIRAALAEGTKEARLLLHAGELCQARSESELAEVYFAEARALASALTPSERALLARRTQPGAGVAAR